MAKVYNFDYTNPRRPSDDIVADRHVEGENCYWLLDDVHDFVVIVPMAWITGGDVKELAA